MDTIADISADTLSDNGDEEQDEPSSSIDLVPIQELNKLTIDSNQRVDDPLASFREQWQRELESSPNRYKNNDGRTEATKSFSQYLDNEELAKQLFMEGVENEQKGKLYEAIKYYKRAVQLVPDIEFKIYDKHKHKTNKSAEIQQDIENDNIDNQIPRHSKQELKAKIMKKMRNYSHICLPEFEAKGTHISSLPHELIQLVLRWVVSSELDAVSLERVSAVCRGFYIASRDQKLWQMMCAKTWGINCGELEDSCYKSWRHMFIERPRLKFNGCYISRTTYLRHGENSFQDQFYRPWFQIVYYRYLRFFPEGTAIMLTTADDPAISVAQLRRRTVRPSQGMAVGHYRLIGDRVLVEMKKQQPVDNSTAWNSNNRYRSRKKEVQETNNEQTFHMEFHLCPHKSRRNCQLIWSSYSVNLKYRSGSESNIDFDLTSSKFPPLWFSGVRSYHAIAESPLT